MQTPPKCIRGDLFYLAEQRPLVFLQLLLEAGVGAGVGAHGLGGSQAALPAQLRHRHQVGHQDGGAAGHPGQAGTAPGSGVRERIPRESPLGCGSPRWGAGTRGLGGGKELSRRCCHPPVSPPQACPMFWMLGWCLGLDKAKGKTEVPRKQGSALCLSLSLPLFF